MCFIVSVLVVQNYAFCSPVWVLMISESPGSVTVKQPTRKYLPEMFQSISSLRTILAVSGSSPVKILTAGSSQFDVITLVVVDTGLGQHSVVFDFGSTQLWGVISQNDQLSLALTELTDGFSVTQVVFTWNYRLESF